ncbi:hypothetical protein YC2023_074050 [Brassica napus]
MERLITYDNHPNIIRSCGFVSNKQYCYIFSEFCRCSLDRSINLCSSKETEKDKSATNPTLINDSLHPFVDEKNCVENLAKNQPLDCHTKIIELDSIEIISTITEEARDVQTVENVA